MRGITCLSDLVEKSIITLGVWGFFGYPLTTGLMALSKGTDYFKQMYDSLPIGISMAAGLVTGDILTYLKTNYKIVRKTVAQAR